MNIRNSKVSILDSVFEANFADQIDLDFCTGTVKENTFRFITEDSMLMKDPNGDGLDVSGSKVSMQENTFEGFLDKALSVGENSIILIKDNLFDNNHRAITVKDGSRAYVLTNSFLNNKFDFSLYIKKKFYNDPRIFIDLRLPESMIDNQLTNSINSVSLLSEAEIINRFNAEQSPIK